LWRLLAEQDTTLSYEPARPAGAPTSLEAGKLHTFFATGPFIVRSAAQNPFYFAQTMTSGRYPGPPSRPDQDGNPGGIGDVEVVPVLPRSEWSNRYVFFPDPTHPETNLVLVRHRQKDGTFASVTLDCAGVLGGWQVVGADYEYTRIDLSRGDFEPQTYSGGTCRNQIARLSSSGAFQLTVWGWGNGQTSEFPSGVSSYAWTARGFPFIEH
jgi:hypothetical protein